MTSKTRIAGAVSAAFAVMVVSTMVLHLGVGWSFPDEFPDPRSGRHPALGWIVGFFIGDLLIGALGGYVSARITGKGGETRAGLSLAAVILILSGLTLAGTWGMEPVWYQIARLLCVPVVILGGAHAGKMLTSPKS